jgi:hypothetical protein
MKTAIKMKGCAVLFGIIFLIPVFLDVSCNSGNSGDYDSQNQCGGPVPSLMEDWNNTYHYFKDNENDNPVVVISDGQLVLVGGIYHDGLDSYPMVLTGTAEDDYNADLSDGAIDWDRNGKIEDDETLNVVEGTFGICANKAMFSELFIEGHRVDDSTGSYIGPGTTAPQLSSVVYEIAILYNHIGEPPGQITPPPEPFSCTGPGWDSSSDKAVYRFRDPIRIGDDEDYNRYHDPDFRISRPTGLSYSASFSVPDECNFSTAKIQYTIAGAIEAAKIYLNDSLVGRTCNPGNSAASIKTCDDINITDKLKPGKNKLRVDTVLYPGDDVSPYDDIEIYNMRVTLTR